MRHNHPEHISHLRSNEISNRLHRGEVSDFGDAMRDIVEGMACERASVAAWNVDLEADEQRLRQDATVFEQYGNAAFAALHVYLHELTAAEQRVLGQLRARANDPAEPLREHYQQFAEALDAHDYTTLAW
jgi:hypothetical protein